MLKLAKIDSMKNTIVVSAFSLLITALCTNIAVGSKILTAPYSSGLQASTISATDTIPPPEVLEVIRLVINAANKFNVEALADLYTPNAVIADDEPPYSWNGPTAGIQWLNAVEQACKENRLTNLKGRMDRINVCQHNDGNVYIVVPVSFTGNLPGRREFSAVGAFTFVLRQSNGKWLIKSQAWMPQKGM